MNVNQFDFESEYLQIIMKQINQFRKDPKSYSDKLRCVKDIKKIKDYKEFINTLKEIPQLIPDKELFQLAKEELEKFSSVSDYNYYQIGQEFQNEFSQDFDKEKVSLIALESLDDIEDIIQRIIINDLDEEKKGRKIITNGEYTHIGFCKSEDNSIIIIFAKKEVAKNKIKDELIMNQQKNDEIKGNIIEKEKSIILTEEENKIMNQIKEFRESPKSFIDKKELIKSGKRIEDNLRSERNNFINILNITNQIELITSMINLDKFLDKNLNKTISYFDYNFMNKFDKISLKDYTNIILTKLILEKDNKK